MRVSVSDVSFGESRADLLDMSELTKWIILFFAVAQWGFTVNHFVNDKGFMTYLSGLAALLLTYVSGLYFRHT